MASATMTSNMNTQSCGMSESGTAQQTRIFLCLLCCWICCCWWWCCCGGLCFAVSCYSWFVFARCPEHLNACRCRFDDLQFPVACLRCPAVLNNIMIIISKNSTGATVATIKAKLRSRDATCPTTNKTTTDTIATTTNINNNLGGGQASFPIPER